MDVDLEAYFSIVVRFISLNIRSHERTPFSQETTAHNGLRTHLFLNVPPVDASPFAETILTGPQGLKEMIGRFNEKFTARVAKYARDNPGKLRKHHRSHKITDGPLNLDQVIMTFDAASVFTDILSDPHRFGFNNTKEYVFHRLSVARNAEITS